MAWKLLGIIIHTVLESIYVAQLLGSAMLPNNFPMPFKEGPYKGKLRAKKRKQAAQLGLAPPPTKVNSRLTSKYSKI